MERFAPASASNITGKNASPLWCSRALPPSASGAFAIPATARRKSSESTGGRAVVVTPSGSSPRFEKRPSTTAPMATTPIAASRRSHQGWASRAMRGAANHG
jgi:hypothetical protein